MTQGPASNPLFEIMTCLAEAAARGEIARHGRISTEQLARCVQQTVQALRGEGVQGPAPGNHSLRSGCSFPRIVGLATDAQEHLYWLSALAADPAAYGLPPRHYTLQLAASWLRPLVELPRQSSFQIGVAGLDKERSRKVS